MPALCQLFLPWPSQMWSWHFHSGRKERGGERENLNTDNSHQTILTLSVRGVSRLALLAPAVMLPAIAREVNNQLPRIIQLWLVSRHGLAWKMCLSCWTEASTVPFLFLTFSSLFFSEFIPLPCISTSPLPTVFFSWVLSCSFLGVLNSA